MQQKSVKNMPSLTEIRNSLETMIKLGDVVELRIFDQFNRKYCGWFTDLDRMAEAALSHDDTAEGTYYSSNACKTDMLAIANNRISRCIVASKEDDIIRRRLFGIDIDPVRKAKISSTDAEKLLAYNRALEVTAWLRELGFPEPVLGDSGNGYHADYFVDLPNTPEIKQIYADAYKAIQHRFLKDAVDVQGFSDANRVWKVYGTVARKGDSTAERPHRRSKLLSVPAKKEYLSLETLIKLASLAPEKQQKTPSIAPSTQSVTISTTSSGMFKPWTPDDMKRWLETHGASIYRTKTEGDVTHFVLDICLNNPTHTGNHEADVRISSNGVIGYKCHHNSCAGVTWKEVRTKHDKEYAESQRRHAEQLKRLNSRAALEKQTTASEQKTTIYEQTTKLRRVKPIRCKGIRTATEGVIKGRRGDAVTALVRAMRFWGEATEEQTLKRIYKFCDMCEPPLQLSAQSLEEIHEFFGSPVPYISPCTPLVNNGLCEEANCVPMIRKRKKESDVMIKEIREAMNAKYGNKNSSPSPATIPSSIEAFKLKPESQPETLKEPDTPANSDSQKVSASAREWKQVRKKQITRETFPEVLDWIYSHTGISSSVARTFFIFKTQVKIIRDIPNFVGIDETLYSLKAGMETTLPEIFVKNLIQKHAVEIIGEVVEV